MVQHHYSGHSKGWALKIETFWARNGTSEGSAIWAQKTTVTLIVNMNNLSIVFCVRRGVANDWKENTKNRFLKYKYFTEYIDDNDGNLMVFSYVSCFFV